MQHQDFKNEMKREILLTNDDSYKAQGINIIAQILRKFGNVLMIAPSTPQSAKSMALTMDSPIYLTKYDEFEPEEGKGRLECYHLDGTPADCSKMIINQTIERHIQPDLFVAGVNHGSNASAGCLYSGTLGACKEGCLVGIPSIGLSLSSKEGEVQDFSSVEKYASPIIEQLFQNPPVLNTFLNVNFPNIPADQVKGIHFSHQGNGRWEREFVESSNVKGKKLYWMVGQFVNYEEKAATRDADHLLLEDGYVTITPLKIDSTNYAEKERLSKLWKL